VKRHLGSVPRSSLTMGASKGDVVSVTYSLKPDLKSGRASSFGTNADKITDSLSFDQGDVTFVVGGGGYIDGIHKTVLGMDVGESVSDISIDAGYGEYNEEGLATVPIEQAPAGLKQGMAVMLSTPNGQIQATVTEMNDETLTLDTNHPLAGCKFLLNAEVTSLEPPSNFEVATVAGGCFWGLELAYQREPGVVGTSVGYTQGEARPAGDPPTYQQVCSGTTGHTEGVQVVFDPRVVSYKRLCELLVDRLGDSIYLLNQVGNDRGTQYRHGIYPHSSEQDETARAVLAAVGEHKTLGPVQTEVEEAAKFWTAEEYHLQYLQKGGQSAKKRAAEEIRCYG